MDKMTDRPTDSLLCTYMTGWKQTKRMESLKDKYVYYDGGRKNAEDDSDEFIGSVTTQNEEGLESDA